MNQTPQRNRIGFLDFGKGFAMTSIVVFHLLDILEMPSFGRRIIEMGGSGIHLFILLSGFGLMLGRYDGAANFFKRRLSKILLPYFLCVTLIFIFNFFMPLYPKNGIYAYFGHIFLFKMFDENIMRSFGYHFWFMSTIIQFYLLFPLLLIVFRKIDSRPFFGLSFLLSTAYWGFLFFYGHGDDWIWNRAFIQFLWEFSLGMVLADLYKRQGVEFWNENSFTLAAAAAAGAFLAVIIIKWGGEVGRVFNDIPILIGYAAGTMLFYRMAKRWLPLVKKAFVKIGELSFSLYLTHFFIIRLLVYILTEVMHKPSISPIYALFLFPFLIIAAKFYQFIAERQNQIFNKRLGDARPVQ